MAGETGPSTDFSRVFWVAEDDGRLVGFIHGRFRDISAQVLERWKATKVGHVTLMAVAPSHRRRG